MPSLKTVQSDDSSIPEGSGLKTTKKEISNNLKKKSKVAMQQIKNQSNMATYLTNLTGNFGKKSKTKGKRTQKSNTTVKAHMPSSDKPPESGKSTSPKDEEKVASIPNPNVLKKIDKDTIEATVQKQQSNEKVDKNEKASFHKPSSDKVVDLDRVEKSLSEEKEDNLISDHSMEEDDDDTIVSGETINPNKPTTHKNCCRFRLMLDIKKIDPEQYKKTHKLTTTPDWIVDKDKRMRKMLMAWYSHLQTVDTKLKIFSWVEKDGTVLAKPDGISNDEKKRSQFFKGLKAKEAGRSYAQIYIYSKLDPQELITKTEQWHKEHNMELTICIVQSEFALEVGWLGYTDPYTHAPEIKAFMEKITDFEWGFKQGPVSKRDFKTADGKPTPFYKRSRALVPVVCSQFIGEAINAMECVFGYKKEQSPLSKLCPFSDRYIFMRNEKDISKESELFETFQLLVTRHKDKEDHVDGLVIDSIITDIDRNIHTKHFGTLTLRQMIYNITFTDSEGEVKPLFFNIDKTFDGSSVWFKNGRKGTGGLGYILTYHIENSKKASMMVKGLPIYLSTVYGHRAVKNKFSYDVWESLAGWKYDIETDTFDTPQAKMLASMMTNDMYASVLKNVAHTDEQKEQIQSSETAMKNLAEKTIMMKLNKPKDDIIEKVQKAKSGKPIVEEVVVDSNTTKQSEKSNQDDDASTTSSLTFDSTNNNINNRQLPSDGSDDATVQTSNSIESAQNSIKTFLSQNSLFSALNPDKLLAQWDHSKTEEENRDMLFKFAQHSIRKAAGNLLNNIGNFKSPPVLPTTSVGNNEKRNKRSIDRTTNHHYEDDQASQESPRKYSKPDNLMDVTATDDNAPLEPKMDTDGFSVTKVKPPDDHKDNPVYVPLPQSPSSMDIEDRNDANEVNMDNMGVSTADSRESTGSVLNFVNDLNEPLAIFDQYLDMKNETWTVEEKFVFRALAVGELLASDLYEKFLYDCENRAHPPTLEEVANLYLTESEKCDDKSGYSKWIFPPKAELAEIQRERVKISHIVKGENSETRAQGMGDQT